MMDFFIYDYQILIHSIKQYITYRQENVTIVKGFSDVE